jgi:rhodanese-related sulfurtransferase
MDIDRRTDHVPDVVGVRRRSLEEPLDEARARIDRLEPHAARAAVSRGAVIVDIRSALDRERDGIVSGSLHIPRTVLEWRLDPDSAWRNPCVGSLDQQIVLLCDHGCSSSLAAATLADLGFTHVGDVIGGFTAWRNAGLPTTQPSSSRLGPGELPGMRPPDT